MGKKLFTKAEIKEFKKEGKKEFLQIFNKNYSKDNLSDIKFFCFASAVIGTVAAAFITPVAGLILGVTIFTGSLMEPVITSAFDLSTRKNFDSFVGEKPYETVKKLQYQKQGGLKEAWKKAALIAAVGIMGVIICSNEADKKSKAKEEFKRIAPKAVVAMSSEAHIQTINKAVRPAVTFSI